MNESLFNKFGIAFVTSHISIFVQQKIESCIECYVENNEIKELSRKSFEMKDIETPKRMLQLESFNNIDFIKNPKIVDSQHVIFRNSIDYKKDNIFILGSPSNYVLDAHHHTKPLYRFLRSKLEKFLG